MISSNRFKPFPAQSAGLITNYRCSFRCAHCLYCASPEIREEIQEDRLEALIRQMDRVLGPVQLHIGGGEPLIYFERIRRLLSALRKTQIIVEYVETNGSSLLRDRREKLDALQREGLNCLLVSISPFHNAFIGLHQLKPVIRDVLDVFGREGLFPWHPGYLSYLERVSATRTMPVDQYFSCFSSADIQHQLTSIMYIHPGGRAASFLARHLPCRPAEALLEKDCAASLTSPIHAHLDYKGNYLTGFCSGLRFGEEEGLDLDRLYREGIRLSRYPILGTLVQKGIGGLYGYALKGGYVPRKEGYVSPCHLCLDIRVFLYSHEAMYPEFYPRFFYEALSRGGKPNGFA